MADTQSAAQSQASSTRSSRRTIGAKLMRSPLFPAMTVFNTNALPYDVTRANFVFEVAQLFGLVLHPYLGGNHAAYDVPYTLLLPLWDGNLYAGAITYSGFTAIFWVTVALLLGIVLGFAASLNSRGMVQSLLLSHGLFAAAHSLSTWLFMPALFTLLAPIACSPATTTSASYWFMWPTEGCAFSSSGSTHAAAQLIVGIVFASMWTLAAYTLVACVADRDCASSGRIKARPHSVVDGLEMLFRVLAVVCFHLLLPRGYVSGYLFVVVLMLIAVGVAHAFLMPYYSHRANRIKCGAYFAAAAVGIVGYIDARTATVTFEQSGGLYMAVLAAAFVAGAVGYACGGWRLNPMTEYLLYKTNGTYSLPHGQLSPFERALRSGDVRMLPFPTGLCKGEMFFTSWSTISIDIIDEATDAGELGDVDTIMLTPQVVSPTIAHVYTASDVEVATRLLADWYKATGHQPTPHMRAFCAKVLAKGAGTFGFSEHVNIAVARFISTFAPSAARLTIGLEVLDEVGGSMSPSLCALYQVYSYSEEIRKSLGLRDRSRQELLSAASRAHRDALAQTVQLWKNAPRWTSANHVASISHQCSVVGEFQAEALRLYRRGCTLAPDDDQIMTAFAQFLTDVMHEEVGADLRNEAEQIASARRSTLLMRKDSSLRSGASSATGAGGGNRAASIVNNLVISSRVTHRTTRNLRLVVASLFAVLLLGGGAYAATFFTFQAISDGENSVRKCAQLRQLIAKLDVTVATLSSTIATASGSSVDLATTSAQSQLLQVQAIGRAIQVTRNDLLIGDSKITYPAALSLLADPRVIVLSDNAATGSAASFEMSVSVLEVIDRLTAAAEAVGATPSTGWSLLPNSSAVTILRQTSSQLVPALLHVDTVLLPWISINVNSALVTAAVILVGMSALGLLLLGGISYILREEAVLKTQFIALFGRIPRHALQQMTSKARHLYSTFAAAEQDGDDLDGDDPLQADAQQVASSKDATKPAAGGGASAATNDDDDDNQASRTIDITEDEVKHSALLSLVVRRGSVNVQRASHLVQASKDDSDHHDHSHAKAATAPAAGEPGGFETDFSAAWKAMSAADSVADWEAFEDAPNGKVVHGKADGSTLNKVQGISNRISAFFLTCLVVISAGFVVSLAGAATAHDAAGLNVTETSLEATAFRCVNSGIQLALTGRWRSLLEVRECRGELLDELNTRDPYANANAAAWALKVRAPLHRVHQFLVISSYLAARSYAFNTSLAPDETLNSTELTAIASGKVSLWSQSTIDSSAYSAAQGQLPFSNSSVDLCASCGVTLSTAAAAHVQQIAVNVIASKHVAADLTIISDASSAYRSSIKQTVRLDLASLSSRSELLWGGGAAVLAAVVGLVCILVVLRGEAARMVPAAVTLVLVVLVGIASVAISFQAASNDAVRVSQYRTAFAVADSASQIMTALESSILAAASFVAVGRPDDLRRFVTASAESSLDAFFARTSALQLSKQYGMMSMVNAQRRQLVTETRAAVAIAASAYSPWLDGTTAFNFNRTAEASYGFDDLTFSRDLGVGLPEAGRGSFAASSGVVYSTKLIDWGKLGDAVRTISSDAYQFALSQVRVSLRTSMNANLQTTWSFANTTTTDNNSVLGGVIAVSAIGLCAVCTVISALILSSISSIANGEDGSERLFDREFKPMQSRSFVTLFVIVAGFLVIFGVTFQFLTTRLNSVGTVTSVFEKTTAFQRSASIAAQIIDQSTSAVPSAAQIAMLQRSLAETVNQTRYLSSDGYFSPAGAVVRQQASGIDALVFGPSSPRPVLVPRSAACYDSFGVLGNQQDLTSIVGYMDLTARAILAIDANAAVGSAEVMSRLVKLANQIQGSYSSAISALRIADAQYASAIDSQRTLHTAVLAALYVVVVVAVSISIVVILWPVERRVEEQSATIALLLASLPDDVKSNVPELSEYFNAGTFGDDEKKNLAQSEQLLQNILPPVISRRLKSGETPIADDHPHVTVVFAQLCNFDKYAAKMEAREMVVAMNRIIVTFDDIVDQLDLEKIKTIGDIYFLCGGLTSKTAADHPLRGVECALNFVEALEEFAQRNTMPDLKLKVGIHTGAAVAGVIGSSKVAYDLWGDTVNTSSRMMSTGKEGRMQLMAATYNAVKDYFSFDESAVNAKGKGQLKTYLWAGRKGLPSPYHGKVNWRKSLQ